MRCKKLTEVIRDIETEKYKWKLTRGHELIYWERGSQKEAQMTASLVATEPEALVVSVTVHEDEDRISTGLVKLKGKWQLDSKNRITFSVKRGLGYYDKLTFQGAWEVNDHHEVVYTYQVQQVLEGRGKNRREQTRSTHELVFKGEWDLSEKNKLTYLLGASSTISGGEQVVSAFRFRGTFETQSILAKKGEIRYRVGVEYQVSQSQSKRIERTIALFGEWKISDTLELSFEIEYADGRKSQMRVGATFTLPEGVAAKRFLPDEISVNLLGRSGAPLGVELILTKDLFEGGVQTFVRFLKSSDESAVEAGIKIPW